MACPAVPASRGSPCGAQGLPAAPRGGPIVLPVAGGAWGSARGSSVEPGEVSVVPVINRPWGRQEGLHLGQGGPTPRPPCGTFQAPLWSGPRCPWDKRGGPSVAAAPALPPSTALATCPFLPTGSLHCWASELGHLRAREGVTDRSPRPHGRLPSWDTCAICFLQRSVKPVPAARFPQTK